MPSCVVPTCKNSTGITNKQDTITCHLFPADENRKSEWVNIVQKARLEQFWKPFKRSVICSIHFDGKYFYDTKGGYRRLRKGALPNKNLALAPENSESRVEIHGPSASVNDIQLQLPTRSNSEIGDVNISDIDSVFDTPRKAILRSRLRRKQIISERRKRRLKILQQKNRRLAKNKIN